MNVNSRRRWRPALGFVAAMLALAPLTAGEIVVRHRPARTPVLKVKPDPDARPTYDGYSWHHADGTRGQRFEIAGYTLEFRYPPPSRADADFLVTLFGPDVDEEWRLTPGFFRDVESAGRSIVEDRNREGGGFEPTEAPPSTYEELGLALERALEPMDLVTLEQIGAELRRHVGLEALRGGIGEVQVPELPPTTPQGCWSAIAKLLAVATGAASCWASTPVTFGLHGAGCVVLTAATGLSALAAWEACDLPCPWCNDDPPYPPPAGDGLCDDGPPPCHGGCDLDPGDSCMCSCPGQPCCEWPETP